MPTQWLETYCGVGTLGLVSVSQGAALRQQEMTTERQTTSDSSSVNSAWMFRLTLAAAA